MNAMMSVLFVDATQTQQREQRRRAARNAASRRKASLKRG